MPDSAIAITAGSGNNIDTRTESTNSNHRQVIVLGDPATNDSVADVRGADPSSNAEGLVVRDVNTSAIVSGLDSVRVRNVIDGTLTTITGVDRIRNVIDGTITTITGLDRVRNIVDGTISTVDTVNYVTRIRNLVDGTITTVDTLNFVTRVRNIVDGTISLANIQATAVVSAAGGSVAGSTSGVSTSGVTIVSPETGRNIKVYAFSLTTTAQVHNQVRFTNGAGVSPTTFWQVGLQAPSQGIAGANLAVTPPGYLFSTGNSTTLSLVKDTGSLVHYSVSYFKESA